MEAVKEAIKMAALDISITQQGDNLYMVSGKDAARLYEKLQQIPMEGRNIDTGALVDGSFTISKMPTASNPAQKAAANA